LPSGKRAPRLIEVRALAVWKEDFRQHLQLVAVAQGRLVVMRDPHRPGIEVQAVVERRGLWGTVLFADGPATNRETAAAGARSRLEDAAVVAPLAKLVGHRHAGKSAAENHHPDAGHAANKAKGRLLHRSGEKSQAGHRLVGQRHAAHRGGPRPCTPQRSICRRAVCLGDIQPRVRRTSRRNRPMRAWPPGRTFAICSGAAFRIAPLVGFALFGVLHGHPDDRAGLQIDGILVCLARRRDAVVRGIIGVDPFSAGLRACPEKVHVRRDRRV
jgi:hypothetical protein